jgi:hypothetical protein
LLAHVICLAAYRKHRIIKEQSAQDVLQVIQHLRARQKLLELFVSVVRIRELRLQRKGLIRTPLVWIEVKMACPGGSTPQCPDENVTVAQHSTELQALFVQEQVLTSGVTEDSIELLVSELLRLWLSGLFGL